MKPEHVLFRSYTCRPTNPSSNVRNRSDRALAPHLLAARGSRTASDAAGVSAMGVLIDSIYAGGWAEHVDALLGD
jgi:hypothetical protein